MNNKYIDEEKSCIQIPVWNALSTRFTEYPVVQESNFINQVRCFLTGRIVVSWKMILGKKRFCGCLIFLCLLCCSGEKFDAVSNEDAGRLLYWSGKGKDAVLVFQKCVTGTEAPSQWECTYFRSNNSITVNPKHCRLLNYTETELTPESAAMELAYWTCVNGNSIQAFCYRKIATKMNSPVTNKLLFFYSDLNEYRRSAYRALADYRTAATRMQIRDQMQQSSPANRKTSQNNTLNKQNSVSALVEDRLRDSLKSPVAVKRIQDECDTEKNFFLALCMYIKYRNETLILLRSIANPEIRKEVLEDLDKLGEEIREKYLQGRTRNQNREHNFQSVCRNMHGRWEWAPPPNLEAISPFVHSCYRAWQQTRSLSPTSEFPGWGNAMLEVLQMIQSPALEQKFDTSLAEYQKYNN